MFGLGIDALDGELVYRFAFVVSVGGGGRVEKRRKTRETKEMIKRAKSVTSFFHRKV